MHEVEARFTEVGAVLHEQVRLSKELREQGECLCATSARSAEGGESVLGRLDALSQRQLAACEEVGGQVSALAGQLAGHGERLTQLVEEQRELMPLFASLKPLRSSFRIEAATLPADLRGSFEGVTAEIGRLDEEIQTNFQAQMEELTLIHEEVTQITHKLQAQAASLQALVTANRQTIARALREVARERDELRETDHFVSEAAARVEACVDRIAVSLQYQDITRQKLEHVQSAMDEIAEGLRSQRTRESSSRLHAACQVQLGQLAAVDEEIEHAAVSVGEGLGGISAELEHIEAGGFSVEKQRQASTRVEDLAKTLQRDQQAIQNSLRKALAELLNGIEATRRFADTSTATDAMRRLAADLKLMGINAQIKSVQVNHGGLEVLSREASRISVEAGPCIHAFEEHFHSASSSLSEALAGIEGVAESIRQAAATDEGGDESLAQALDDELAQRGAAIEATHGIIGQLAALSRKMRDSATLAEVDRSALNLAREAVVAVSGLFKARGPSPGDNLHSLSRHYTMESERAIHDAALKQLEPGRPPNGPQKESQKSVHIRGVGPGPMPKGLRPSSQPPIDASANSSNGVTSGNGDNVEFF